MKKNQFSEYLRVIIKWRRFIIRNVFIVAVIAIIISLLLVKKYRATATVLPPSAEQQTMLGLMPGLMSGGGIPGGLSSMLTGVVSGFATPSDLYAAIMQSSRIMRVLITKYNLKKEFKAKTTHDAFLALEDITQIQVSPEGIISVSVTYKNKQLATDMANSYVEELDKFNQMTAMTVGKKFRIFVEQRLLETSDSLRKAEEELRDFQEGHRTVALDTEMQAAIETIAQLKSQIIMYEVQKGAWSAAGQVDNPYLAQINRELNALKKQLSKMESGTPADEKPGFGAGFSVPLEKLPEVTLEFARKYREVKIQEAIFELMTQQYEQAKIMELKDTPTIQFLDRAGVPEKRVFPKRALIVVITFIISFIVNVFLVFSLEYINDIKVNPKAHKTAIDFTDNLHRDYRDIKSFIKKTLRFKKH
ncbi:MAG: hypothetical protein JSV98_05220 [candidate division WOR-3 bacterium]|nr:MAG: hypothetical protein JSV98_05220 [candidate division WOR-3 bacterium]